MITLEPSQHEETAGYVCSLGYFYCCTCKDKVSRPVQRVPADSMPDDTRCDWPGCGKPIAESVEVVSGLVTIEHFACKVF
jgi:hypothetical protein